MGFELRTSGIKVRALPTKPPKLPSDHIVNATEATSRKRRSCFATRMNGVEMEAAAAATKILATTNKKKNSVLLLFLIFDLASVGLEKNLFVGPQKRSVGRKDPVSCSTLWSIFNKSWFLLPCYCCGWPPLMPN